MKYIGATRVSAGIVAHVYADANGKVSVRCDIGIHVARVLTAAAHADGMNVRDCCIQSLVDTNRHMPAEVVEALADAISAGVENAIRDAD